MIPLHRYENTTKNPYSYEIAKRTYKNYKLSLLAIKTNRSKAKEVYKIIVQEMQSSPEVFDIAAYLRVAKLALLLNHKNGKNHLDEAERKIIELRAKSNDSNYSGDDEHYLIACSKLAKLYFPINPEKAFTYLDTIKTNIDSIEYDEQVIFNCKYLTKCYIVTNQPDKCINLVKNIVGNDLLTLNSTAQAWTLLKFTKQILPLDTDYGKSLLQLAAKTILPLNDKVLEKELKHVKLFADIL